MRRRGFLEHVAWTGAGIAFALGADGVIAPVHAEAAAPLFVQISDSHVGFSQAANPDVTATLERAVARINALPAQPAFVVHTGDVTHLATAEQFAQAREILGALRAPLVTIPGEHDVIGDGRARFAQAFGRADAPDGWFSWDQGGVHCVALVNVFGGETMGRLGEAQLAWLEKDLASRPPSTPLVVFGHVPLFALYPAWGWTTDDGARAIALLRRFSSVTVLNGHVHQIVSHVEGSLRFYTAAATAYPQPAPGTAARPGPLAVPPDHLLHVLGYRTVELDAAGTQVDDHDLA